MAKTTYTRIVSAQLAEPEAARLEELAKASDRSLSAEIRRAVREHIAREAALDAEARVTA